VNGRLLEQRVKQILRRTVGEPYVGKRLKLRWLESRLGALGLRPRRILDAGAEDATFTYWLADRFPDATVTAVDVDAQAVATCAAARPGRYAERVDFVASEFGDLPETSYDLVMAFDVLEHISDDVGALRNLHDAMTPDGILLVHVPANPIVDANNRPRWVTDEDAWRINAGHVRHGYSPGLLRTRVERAGFRVLSCERWTRRYGQLAFRVYEHLERPRPLRLATLPVTDALAALDRSRPEEEGRTVWLVAQRNGGY
jgi:SAM-dependent methyltransferase